MAKNSTETSLKTRPLSYVNLSCSVNGYSELTCYNSEARRELRSRENSRDRAPLFYNKSRDGSPLRPSEIPAVPFSTLGGLLSPIAVMELNHKFSRCQNGSVKANRDDKPPVCPPRSKSVDRGYLRREKNDRQTFLSSFLNNNDEGKSTGFVQIPVILTNEKHGTPERGRVRTKGNPTNSYTSSLDFHFKEIEVVPPITPDNAQSDPLKSASTGKKTFVQQRIERLYGPGALARNYLSFSKSPKKNVAEDCLPSDTADDTTDNASPKVNGCSTPPVFRHLRPEFRDQLSVKKISPPKFASKRLFVGPDKPTTLAISVLPPDNLEVLAVSVEQTHSDVVSSDAKESISLPEGHKFLKILQVERERITILIREAEMYIGVEEVESREDVKGMVLAALGKGKLLLAQKFEQFAGLCNKNIKPPANDPFPTTGGDLAGFWDMVCIQVEHINDLFAHLKQLKKVNWDLDKMEITPRAATKKSAIPSAAPKRRPVVKTSVPVVRSSKAEEAAKARDIARRKLNEMKKSMSKTKEAGIEIYA